MMTKMIKKDLFLSSMETILKTTISWIAAWTSPQMEPIPCSTWRVVHFVL